MKKIPLGPIMTDLRGLQLETDEHDMLMHPHTGGVILFTRNFESLEQITTLCKRIHDLRQPHLLIAVDHEGGRVQRFRDGFSHLPSCASLAKCKTNQDAESLCQKAGWLMAAELLAVGVDISFAPVLDLGGKISNVIGDRAFHTEPDQISRLAYAYMGGMKQAGMSAVGKHFPGHGSVFEDSHDDIPYDCRKYQDIQMKDLIPFERMIRGGLPGLMPAHVIYTEIDEVPAGFSSIWLEQILRKQLKFTGAIFSDDLSMKGAEVMGNYPRRAESALFAGCDMVLACNNQAGAVSILEQAEIPTNIELQSRLIGMHGRFEKNLCDLKKTVLWQERSALILNFNEKQKF
tara:strand:- start:1169 stop:2206 length:1038 start_codon:yes stop_codon:yes gene_type:complete